MGLFDGKGTTFKARIRPGATVHIDRYTTTWPEAEARADLEFEGKDHGTFFDLKAPGYGIIGGDYGNGSVFVSNIADLVLEGEDRQRVYDRRIKEKSKEFADATGKADAIRAELWKLQADAVPIAVVQ